MFPQPEAEQQQNEQQTHVEAPTSFPEGHLLLVVNGCVESLCVWGGRGGALCRYALVAGKDWQHVWGLAGGLSQEGHSGWGGSEVTLNFPFQAAFKGTSPYGWPRVAFCIYGRDWLGRQIVAGYSHTVIPLQPGRHQKRLPIYALVESSTSQRLVAWLKAQRAEYIDINTAAKTQGREVVRAEGVGEMFVVFDVLLRGADSLGYSF
ncbi:hypothetical protein Efla_004437 [Eimeria flavescens]